MSQCPHKDRGLHGEQPNGNYMNKSITMQLFCHFLERLPCTSWPRLLEQTGQLMGLFCKIPLLTLGRLTREYSLASIYFIRRVKSSEILVVHSALYLKECGVVLMRYLSQSTSPLDPGAPYVATSRSGIPPAFFVPPHYRKLLRKRDKRAMMIARFLMSWFTLSRLITLAKPITKSTFKPMTEPSADIESVKAQRIYRGKTTSAFPSVPPRRSQASSGAWDLLGSIL